MVKNGSSANERKKARELMKVALIVAIQNTLGTPISNYTGIPSGGNI